MGCRMKVFSIRIDRQRLSFDLRSEHFGISSDGHFWLSKALREYLLFLLVRKLDVFWVLAKAPLLSQWKLCLWWTVLMSVISVELVTNLALSNTNRLLMTSAIRLIRLIHTRQGLVHFARNLHNWDVGAAWAIWFALFECPSLWVLLILLTKGLSSHNCCIVRTEFLHLLRVSCIFEVNLILSWWQLSLFDAKNARIFHLS